MQEIEVEKKLWNATFHLNMTAKNCWKKNKSGVERSERVEVELKMKKMNGTFKEARRRLEERMR